VTFDQRRRVHYARPARDPIPAPRARRLGIAFVEEHEEVGIGDVMPGIPCRGVLDHLG
jgi:hypothetical protein